ncbi:hypothetical protein HWV62_19533 [Athelia sp. TMB]|nr:hypothetical protein HWV62_19533 [Athelia sp. TMB]
MFKSGQPNPYDDIVNKTTDENLTDENWELILNLCDKVQDEGEQGARNVVAAVLKRLTHRIPNVQLYALSLAESLSKNCGLQLHRELASKAFTQGLEKLITDRNTHEKVKRRALVLIAQWTAEFESDPSLGIMEECYNNLKSKGYKFEAPQEAPPPTVDDDIRRKEEEELQRVLEMSVQDKGGRTAWADYSVASSSRAGGSNSHLPNNVPASTATSSSANKAGISKPSTGYTAPKYNAGYVPARTPSPKVQSAASYAAPAPAASTPASPQPAAQAAPQTAPAPVASSVVTRVRALHTFEPTEPGELAFEKGDVIKVVDRGYQDWWRGQLKGRTGIFPVNYVEPMPEPTAAELAKEAEQEASVFMQAANVDKLLTMLREMDPAKDNLADNEEIQELYRSSMALRPKIVKLIDKYSQKRDYEQSRPAYQASMSSFQGRPDSRGGAPQPYGWNAGYEQPGYPAPGPQGFPQGPERGYQGPQPQPQPQGQPQQYRDPNAYPQGPQVNYVQPYPPQATPAPTGPYPLSVPQPQAQSAPQQGLQQGPQQQYSPAPQQQYPVVAQQLAQAAQQAAQAQAQPHHSPAAQHQSPLQIQPQTTQAIAQQPQPQPQQQQLQPQVQPQEQLQMQPQAQAQPQPQQQSGPPYVYDPNGTYADPNVQAWASYYSQGGKDLAGAVYFISIPGVTDEPLQAAPHESSESIQSLQGQPQGTSSPVGQAQGVSQPLPSPGSDPVLASAIQANSPVSGHPGSQPPWAQPNPQGRPLSNPGSPTLQQHPAVGGLSRHQSLAAAQPAGWQTQYNAVQNQMGAVNISGADADQGGQLPYPGP